MHTNIKYKSIYYVLFFLIIVINSSCESKSSKKSRLKNEQVTNILSDKSISIKSSKNSIKILTWNIRDFGKTKSSLTITKIADIVKGYDIVAIQEVVAGYGGAQAVARLADELNRKGAKWDYVISNPTNSPPYKTERYAFLWKPSKVKAIGRGHLLSELEKEVYREPFVIKFKTKTKTFTVYNYHSRKHRDSPEIEVKKLIQYIINQSEPILLVGDFNLNEGEDVFDTFYSNNFISSIRNKKTTLKQKCRDGNYLNYAIDNMYFSKKYFSLIGSNSIDYIKGCNNLIESRIISDHIPIYTVFELNY